MVITEAFVTQHRIRNAKSLVVRGTNSSRFSSSLAHAWSLLEFSHPYISLSKSLDDTSSRVASTPAILNEATRRGEIAGRTNGQGSSTTVVERGETLLAGGCFVRASFSLLMRLLLNGGSPLSPSVMTMRAII